MSAPVMAVAPCPVWCSEPAGHPFGEGVESHTAACEHMRLVASDTFTTEGVQAHVFVELRQSESRDLSTGENTLGPLQIAPVIPDESMTGSQARRCAAILLEAADA